MSVVHVLPLRVSLQGCQLSHSLGCQSALVDGFLLACLTQQGKRKRGWLLARQTVTPRRHLRPGRVCIALC
jgi:hypothetical protein